MRIERTFWEKATAVHVYCLQQRLRQERFSRHWSDLAQMTDGGHAAGALSDRTIADAVGRDKRILYPENDVTGVEIDYPAAVAGRLCLVPNGESRNVLAADYERMVSDGYFPEHPGSFDDVMERCSDLERQANA